MADAALKMGYRTIVFLDDRAVGRCIGFPIAGPLDRAEALRELYDQDIDGVVTSLIELDKDGNLQLLRWEQTEEVNDYPTVIACGEYSFS